MMLNAVLLSSVLGIFIFATLMSDRDSVRESRILGHSDSVRSRLFCFAACSRVLTTAAVEIAHPYRINTKSVAGNPASVRPGADVHLCWGKVRHALTDCESIVFAMHLR